MHVYVKGITWQGGRESIFLSSMYDLLLEFCTESSLFVCRLPSSNEDRFSSETSLVGYWESGLEEVGFVSVWSWCRCHHIYLHVYDTPEVTAPRGQTQRVSLYGNLLAWQGTRWASTEIEMRQKANSCADDRNLSELGGKWKWIRPTVGIPRPSPTVQYAETGSKSR